MALDVFYLARQMLSKLSCAIGCIVRVEILQIVVSHSYTIVPRRWRVDTIAVLERRRPVGLKTGRAFAANLDMNLVNARIISLVLY